MGMFDYVKCDFDMPIEVPDEEFPFQTKDLECELDYYWIKKDGTLWAERYEIEDQSDPDAEGLMALAGIIARVNKRWEQVTCTLGFEFYTNSLDTVHAFFFQGKLVHLSVGDSILFQQGISRDPSE